MPTPNVSHGAAMRLRPGAPRARAFSGVVRFAPTPAYKRRRFEREVKRLHANSVRSLPVTSEGLDLGGHGTYSRGEVGTDWSAA